MRIDSEPEEGIALKERLTWRDCVKHMADDVRSKQELNVLSSH